ncbi:MAG: hypothetical protein ACLGHN_00800 [Bacteriovoracia bacterium]
MKKVLSAILLMVFAGILTGGFLVWQRFQQNTEQVVPFPYVFQKESPPVKLEAPIVITGDRMGHYFGKFNASLAEAISTNLDRPIKVQSIARPGHALHRTLHELRSLTQWPQILIYQGGSEEFSETKFNLAEIKKIRKNFSRYGDDRIETFLILYPLLSRLVYEPIQMVKLAEKPELVDLEEHDYLKRLETELLLFEQQLVQLVAMSKDRNTLLILTTTPINLDEPPRVVCEFSSNTEIDAEILGLRNLLKANNPKEAYNKSSALIKQYMANAELLFIHGQIAKRLGKLEESVDTLLLASAYDCKPWRATEVHNSIIRKVAQNHQVLLFDFAKLVEKDFKTNTTFFDEVHPQNLYYDKGMQQLGMVIKNILKL